MPPLRRSHTIIEIHPEVAARARGWAAGKAGVVIAEGSWQDWLAPGRLGLFDAVFFDDYPMGSEAAVGPVAGGQNPLEVLCLQLHANKMTCSCPPLSLQL